MAFCWVPLMGSHWMELKEKGGEFPRHSPEMFGAILGDPWVAGLRWCAVSVAPDRWPFWCGQMWWAWPDRGQSLWGCRGPGRRELVWEAPEDAEQLQTLKMQNRYSVNNENNKTVIIRLSFGCFFLPQHVAAKSVQCLEKWSNKYYSINYLGHLKSVLPFADFN